MSTTVSYKNNTLTTIGFNDSAILTTQGTWLEDDITINVDALNLQTKTITPSESTQIISSTEQETIFEMTTGYFHDGSSTEYKTFDSTGLSSSDTILITGNIGTESSGRVTWEWANINIQTTYENQTFNGPRENTLTIDPTNNRLIIYTGGLTCYQLNMYKLTIYDGLSQITVNPIPSNYIIPTGTIQISGSGTYDVSSYATAEASFASTINNQNKTITPSESQQTISADSGYTGLGTVTVNAISNTYVGSGITQRTNSDLTASGATVTVPAGYYASQATKSVSTTTHPNPTVSINSSTGLITASHTQTTGYVSAGTTTGTSQLSTQTATTITPTTSSQVAVAAGKYTLGAVTVAAIPANYIDSSALKTYYTGSSAPLNNVGENGDLYFQTSGV